jgi:hypothetical protein
MCWAFGQTEEGNDELNEVERMIAKLSNKA